MPIAEPNRIPSDDNHDLKRPFGTSLDDDVRVWPELTTGFLGFCNLESLCKEKSRDNAERTKAQVRTKPRHAGVYVAIHRSLQ